MSYTVYTHTVVVSIESIETETVKTCQIKSSHLLKQIFLIWFIKTWYLYETCMRFYPQTITYMFDMILIYPKFPYTV